MNCPCLQAGQEFVVTTAVLSGREVPRHDQRNQSVSRSGKADRTCPNRYSESGFQAASRNVRERGAWDADGRRPNDSG